MVRETLWGDVVGTLTTIAGSASPALINVTGGAFLALRPWTVVRARGYWSIESDQTAAAELQGAHLGMAIVSDQAVAIGVTAVPTPTTDAASDLWFVYETLLSSMNAGAGDGQVRDKSTDYDSRAMRKVEDGSQLVVVVETESGAGTSGVVIRHFARILIKLH